MEFRAKVVGFDITADMLSTNNTEKPLLNAYFMNDADTNSTINIFSMDVYGLNFANTPLDGKWVKIRLDIAYFQYPKYSTIFIYMLDFTILVD